MYLDSISLLSQSADQPGLSALIVAYVRSLSASPYLCTVDLPADLEQRQYSLCQCGSSQYGPSQYGLSQYGLSQYSLGSEAVDATVALGSAFTNGKANCVETVLLEADKDHILPDASASVTSTCLHQDFIWKQSLQPVSQPVTQLNCSAMRGPQQLSGLEPRFWPGFGLGFGPEFKPEFWDMVDMALIGLAILPGLWLSYLGLSANLLHQQLLLGIELLLMGFQLFCFCLALAFLIETHQSFPRLSQQPMQEMPR